MKTPSADIFLLAVITGGALYFYSQFKGAIGTALNDTGAALSSAGGAFEGALGIPATQQAAVNAGVGNSVTSGNLGALWNDLKTGIGSIFMTNSTGASKSQILAQAENILRGQEGESSTTYYDTQGVLTGGIGHRILASDGYSTAGQAIPQSTIDTWFSQDANTAYDAAISQASALGKSSDELFVVALICVNFQLGTHWPSVFPVLWTDLLASNAQAAVNDISGTAWADETPSRAQFFQNAILRAWG